MGGNISFELFLAREIMKAKFFDHATAALQIIESIHELQTVPPIILRHLNIAPVGSGQINQLYKLSGSHHYPCVIGLKTKLLQSHLHPALL